MSKEIKNKKNLRESIERIDSKEELKRLLEQNRQLQAELEKKTEEISRKEQELQNKLPKPKPTIPGMKGISVKCSCGEVLESYYTYYLNGMDIARWECPVCGDSILVQTAWKKVAEGKIPKKKFEPNKNGVRFRCEGCDKVIYASKKYVNQLPPRSHWRCQHCGDVYRVIMKTKLNIPTSLEDVDVSQF